MNLFKSTDERDASLFSNCVRLFASRLSVFAFSILTSVIIARSIGPEGRGWLTVFRAYPEMIAVVLMCGMRQSAVFFLSRDQSPQEVFNNLLGWFAIVASAGAVVALALLSLLFPGMAHLSALAAAIVVLTIATNLIQAVLISTKRIKSYSRLNAFRPIVNLVLIVLLFLAMGQTLVTVLVASVISATLVIGGVVFVLRKDFQFKLAFDWPTYRRLLQFGSTAWIALVLFKLLERVDALSLSFVIDVDDLGQLSLAQNNSRFLVTMAGALGPAIWSQAANSDASEANKVYDVIRVSFLATLFFGGCAACVAPWVIPLLYGQDFSTAGSIFPLLIPGVLGMTLLNLANFDIAGKGWPLLFWKPILCVTVLKLLVNFFLAPFLTLQELAFSTSLAYAVCGFLCVRIHLSRHNGKFLDVFWLTAEDRSRVREAIVRATSSLSIPRRGKVR